MNSSRSIASRITRISVADLFAVDSVEMANYSVLALQGAPLLVVDLAGGANLDGVVPAADNTRHQAAGMPACPVVGLLLGDGDSSLEQTSPPAFVDLVVHSEAQLQTIADVVVANPHAAALLVQLLRHTESASVQQGLFAESLTYSTLQHGAEFERWLRERENAQSSSLGDLNTQRGSSFSEPAVRVSREGVRLQVQLNRPERRNAFSAGMRDLLCEALELACLDDGIKEIILSGAGVAFCAGGDLAEFGEARDAGRAHLSRTTRSAGALIHQLRDRVRVQVQGACIGAGIELPAFAGQIHAEADSFFQLPEVTLGLVPGAGGCVSLPRRIGRHRTAFMALSAARIDVNQALEWGLIDEIVGV